MTLLGAGGGVWAFDFEPGPAVLVLSLVGAWVGAVRVLGPRYAPRPRRPVSRSEVVAFFLGVAALVLALGWPIHQLAERYLFSVHMLQHLVISLVAAPLLLLGTPGWMVRAALGRGRLFALVRAVTRPFAAFVLFNFMLVFSHWPAVVDLSLRSAPFHAALHVALLAAALVMWMPLVSPLPELPRLAAPASLLYLFLQSILPTVPASFLTFGDTVLYRFYEDVPRLWATSALGDQQVAGLVMKVGAGFLLWGLIAVLFFVWQAEEEPRAHGPRVDWDELELELADTGSGSR